jgi:hypothetical protein
VKCGNFGHTSPASVSDLFGDALPARSLTLVKVGVVDKSMVSGDVVLNRGESKREGGKEAETA